MDTTGNLVVPRNMTLIFLPSRALELNLLSLSKGREHLAEPARQLALEARLRQLQGHDSYKAIVDAACEAWNRLIAQPQIITSIGMRVWAHTGQT